MTYLEIKTSRSENSQILIMEVCIIFLVVKFTDDLLLIWGSIIGFSPMIIISLWHLFDTKPRLVFDDEGVFDRTLGVGKIAWHDIDDAYIKTLRHCPPFICLVLKNTDEYINRRKPFWRAITKGKHMNVLGITPLSLNLSGISEDPREILSLVLKMSQAKKCSKFDQTALADSTIT